MAKNLILDPILARLAQIWTPTPTPAQPSKKIMFCEF